MPVALTTAVTKKEPTVTQEIYAFSVFPKDNRIDIVIKDYDTDGVENDEKQHSIPLNTFDEDGGLTSSIFTAQLYDDVKAFVYQVSQDNGWIGAGTIS